MFNILENRRSVFIRNLFPVLLLIFLTQSLFIRAQIKDYLPLWSKAESYSMYKVDTCKRLYHVVFTKDAHYGNYDFCGWLQKETADYYQFINITGSQCRFRKKIIEQIVPCQDNADILLHIEKNDDRLFFCGQTILPYVIVAAWAHKNNNDELAMQLSAKAKEQKLDDTSVRNYLAYMYYSDMLKAYSFDRNYKEAVLYADHLAGKDFEGFEYRNNAIALAKQLRSRTADFKTYSMPDSVQWLEISTKMSRKEKVLYLVGKIHLLNCFQNSQPGNIYYEDVQPIISCDSMNTLTGIGCSYRNNYPAINPFNEIVRMKPTPNEVELIVPALLDSSFIPSFSFHRSFKCGRTLHKYNWVINELIFRVTNKRFIDKNIFDQLDFDGKKKVTGDIVIWCRDNSGLSEKERLHKILTESTTWEEFSKALKTAVANKDSSISSILPLRLGKQDFVGFSMPTYDGIIAQAMFELSSYDESNQKVFSEWIDKTADLWVQLWSSMYFIKFDNKNADIHLNSLRTILSNCNSESEFYPYAIKILLQNKDHKLRELAIGTVNSQHLSGMFNNLQNTDILKLLIINKSDSAFEWLNSGLNNFEKDISSHLSINGIPVTILQCDEFVFQIEVWRNYKFEYKQEWPVKQKKRYAIELSKWLNQQYSAIKMGKESKIKMMQCD